MRTTRLNESKSTAVQKASMNSWKWRRSSFFGVLILSKIEMKILRYSPGLSNKLFSSESPSLTRSLASEPSSSAKTILKTSTYKNLCNFLHPVCLNSSFIRSNGSSFCPKRSWNSKSDHRVWVNCRSNAIGSFCFCCSCSLGSCSIGFFYFSFFFLFVILLQWLRSSSCSSFVMGFK